MSEVVITEKFLEGRMARAIRGAYWKPGYRAWLFDPEANLEDTRLAMRLFPELRLRIDKEIVERVDSLPRQDDRPFDVATSWAADRGADELLPNVPPVMTKKLYPFQIVDLGYAAARMRADKGAYLGWDRGLGKTFGALVLCFELNAERVVIVTPNSSKETVWVPEITKWDSTGRFEDRVFVVGGPASRRERTIVRWKRDNGILLVHYEALRLIDWNWTKDRPVDLVIVDEAHRLANGSKSTRAPKFYRALMTVRAEHKLALSGSIVNNSPEDYFGANHWLFPERYKSKWKDWNDKYVHYVEGSFGRVLVGIKPDTLPAMRSELGQFTLVRRKQDELPGLPERIEQTLRVELSNDQRRVYDELADNFLAELPGGELITVGNVLAQLTKLRQVAVGLDLINDGVIRDSAKMDLAEDLIRDVLPNKTVVFTWHRATATALGQRIFDRNIRCSVITGDTPMKTRTMLVDSFQTDPTHKVMIATIKTLGESVTLHSAADVIFLESSWTPSDMEQAADRVYRIGQNHRVTITNILAANTVDETRILPRVLDKAAMRRLVLGG